MLTLAGETSQPCRSMGGEPFGASPFNMIRVVTVADTNFLTQAGRLSRSLETSGNDYELTVFCDDAHAFSALQSPSCKVIELETISALGAKRAKATAYRMAIENGSFLYLDADAIVLDSLEELCQGEAFTGAPDDLSHCPFIEDRRRPWPNAPELENNLYINSGVFYAPVERSSFLRQLEEWFLSDEIWFRYIHTSALFDNHVLCAALNVTGESVRLVDNRVYMWQGLLFQDKVQVRRHGDALVNKMTGQKLKIAIFAGYPQSWETLLSLPLDVLSLLMERVQKEPLDRDSAFASLAASLGPSVARSANSRAIEVTGRLFDELRHVVHARLGRTPIEEGDWFRDPQALIAMAFEPPALNATYNGLRTGGAYLDGEEYGALRRFVHDYKVRSVLETGAGESTHLFSMLGALCVSIETDEGPWLERARKAGAKTFKVSWQESEMQYDQAELTAALLSAGIDSFDLLFVDGPIGTGRRKGVVTQLMPLVRARYIAYHDAHRDARNIFHDQAAFGLRLIHVVESARGLAFFAVGGGRLSRNPENGRTPRLATVDLSAVRVRLADGTRALKFLPRAALSKIRVEVANNNPRAILSSEGTHAVFLSYHWLDHRGKVVVWEGIRTPLPFPLMPEDRCECELSVLAVDAPGEYVLQLALVQEGIAWQRRGLERIVLAIVTETA